MQQISLIPDHWMGFSQISVDLSQNRGYAVAARYFCSSLSQQTHTVSGPVRCLCLCCPHRQDNVIRWFMLRNTNPALRGFQNRETRYASRWALP
jgi:hypothetical protein